MARPELKIDAELVGQMALDGAKNSEIADILGVDDQTIQARFSLFLRKKRAERRFNLRKKQYEKAMKGDSAMLVWLGKNELDQSDKQETRHSGEIKTGGELTVKVVFVNGNDKGNGGNGNKKSK